MVVFEWLKVAFVFLVMISVLVAAHEYGHYLFARLFGMGIEEFCIGMGRKPIWIWMRKRHRIPLTEVEAREFARLKAQEDEGEKPVKPYDSLEGKPAGARIQRVIEINDGVPTVIEEETVYTVRPWPIGGFVRISGMLPEEDGSEVRIPAGFYSKAPWKRFIVLLAGPTFSVLCGVVILFVLFAVSGVNRPNTKILAIAAHSVAASIDLRPGDQIVAIDGKPTPNYFDVVSKIRDSGSPLKLTIERDHRLSVVTATPALDPHPTEVAGPDGLPTGEIRRQYKLGFSPDHDQVMVHLSLRAAASLALERPVQVVDELLSLLQRKVKVEEELSGPLGMVAATKGATDAGVSTIVFLAGMLSISVGIFNLLPIVPLDGGQMVVAIAEMLRGGKRLSYRVQNTVAGVGLLVLAVIVVGAFSLDIGRFLRHGDTLPSSSSK